MAPVDTAPKSGIGVVEELSAGVLPPKRLGCPVPNESFGGLAVEELLPKILVAVEAGTVGAEEAGAPKRGALPACEVACCPNAPPNGEGLLLPLLFCPNKPPEDEPPVVPKLNGFLFAPSWSAMMKTV